MKDVSPFISLRLRISMNRIQFWVLVTLSSLVFLCLGLQAIFASFALRAQVRVAYAQQAIQQGRVCDQRWRQLIERIAEVSQKSQDQGLKDILSRQGVTVRQAPAPSTPSAPPLSPTPAPANP
jgi:hypothetical protein